MDIRTRLRALTLATLIPVVAFGMFGTYVLVEREKATLKRAMSDRALADDRDRAELRASATSLEVLSREPSFDHGDLEAFRIEAARLEHARATGSACGLAGDPARW